MFISSFVVLITWYLQSSLSVQSGSRVTFYTSVKSISRKGVASTHHVYGARFLARSILVYTTLYNMRISVSDYSTNATSVVTCALKYRLKNGVKRL